MATSSMMLRALAVAGMLLTPLAGLPAAVDAAVVHEGDYDDDFAEDGRSRVSFASADNEEAHAVALAPGGKVVVAGWAYNAVGADEDMGIVRYRSDGVLDTSFNHGGIKSLSFGDGTDHAYAVIAQPDGKVVVAGSTLTDHFEMSVARLTVDGSLDRTFSGDGLRHIPLPDNGGEIFGMALQPDGRILLAGYAVVPYPAVYDFAVVRLLPNGALDRTFGGDGVVTTPIRSGSDMAQAISIQPDGKLVVAGWSAVGVDLGAALARYRPDGRLDAGFGTGGLTVLDPGDTDETFNAIALLPGGKIGLAGTSRDSSGIPSGLLARVSSSGALDPGFGSPHTGWFLDPSLGSVNALLKQRDGHLVAVGDAGNKIVVGRFGPGGAPDPDFAGDGEKAASAMLTQHADLDAIWAVWDVPAEGVLAAARAAGRSDLVITTIDLGENVAIDMAKGGPIYGLGAQRPFDQGIAEARLGAYGLLDKKAPPYVAVNALPVTSDTLDQAWQTVYHQGLPDKVKKAQG